MWAFQGRVFASSPDDAADQVWEKWGPGRLTLLGVEPKLNWYEYTLLKGQGDDMSENEGKYGKDTPKWADVPGLLDEMAVEEMQKRQLRIAGPLEQLTRRLVGLEGRLDDLEEMVGVESNEGQFRKSIPGEWVGDRRFKLEVSKLILEAIALPGKWDSEVNTRLWAKFEQLMGELTG